VLPSLVLSSFEGGWGELEIEDSIFSVPIQQQFKRSYRVKAFEQNLRRV
jgi:hypothetical protein